MRSERSFRLVVKVGTSTLTDAHGRVDRGFIADLTAQLAAQRQQGCEILLVTSGAIRAGREALATQRDRPGALATGEAIPTDSLPYKQAAAAIGQGRLIHIYTEAFAWREITCAQILLTRDDLSDRRRFLNARNTLLALLRLDTLPIINENDTIAVDEIKFGDNDMLAALVATLVEADLLLILSDVEGLYAKRDAIEPEVLRTVPRIDAAIRALAGGSGSRVGTGGMQTKIEAAHIATSAGIRTVIARGRRERVVTDVLSGAEVGTVFLPKSDSDRLPARKRWIAHSARSRGAVTTNAQAKLRLQASGVSLLAVGIVSVEGNFTSGDLIEVRDEEGGVYARGLTNYASGEIQRLLGLKSDQFEEVLGYRAFEEVIHRDNLVVLCPEE